MLNQYSPNSEESDDQPLDFSKTSISSTKRPVIPVKQENNRREKHHKTSNPESAQLSRSPPQQTPTNCFTTPSPSPPEHNPNSHHTNQVLCQLLTGNLIPTSTGKLVAAGGKGGINQMALQLQNESALRFNGLSNSSPGMTSSSTPNASVIQALNDCHNSPMSPTGSASPIGLGPLNQVEMHYSQSPNAGVDRFGTSGGLLTTSSTGSVFAANDSAKRALKYNRPFKAYPRDPMSAIPMSYYGVGLQMPLTADAIATQSLLATASDQAYLQFREQMLVSRKNSQQPEPRRPGQQSVPKNSNSTQSTCGSPTPEMVNNSNGNNSNTHNKSNGNNNQNIYINRSITPPKESIHSFGSKLNGSMTPMTPISTASQINSDETLDYSNGHSSGNSSSGEADVGSLASHSGGNGQHSDGDQGGPASMRKRGRPLPEDLKDEAYWERRRKNNEAAKRSRDARRAKEDEIAIRAAFLEQENLKLRCEIASLKTETTKLRCLLYNS